MNLELDSMNQKAAGEKAVEALLARGLALDLEPGRAMEQHDAGGAFVDVLAAVSARAHKGFFNVCFLHAERGHALGEVVLFFQADGKGTHGGRLAQKGRDATAGVPNGFKG